MSGALDSGTATAETLVAPLERRALVRRRASEWLAKPLVLRLLSLLVVLGLWQLIGSHYPYSMSSPSAVVHAGVRDMRGQVLPAFKDTLWSFFLGYGICILVGIPVGLLMARSRVAELALGPYVNALYATPRLAFIPVMIIWLGVTFQLRLAVVIVSGVFPIILNTYLGGKEVDRNLLDAGVAFAASRFQILRTIVIPGSLHFIFAGLRIGLGRALIGVVVAEIEASVVGVGNLINEDAKTLQIGAMFVPIILLGLFSIVCSMFLKRAERWTTMPWSRSRRVGPWPSRA